MKSLIPAFAGLLLSLLSGISQAQSAAMLDQLSPEDRQKALLALQGRGAESSDGAGVAPVVAVAPKSAPPVVDAGEGLPLFGYSLFTQGGGDLLPAQVPVPENYVLGPGDVVRVQLFGNQNETLNLSVTRDGVINFPKLGPIQVAGLSIDNVREVIDRRVTKELIGVQVNTTLGPLRGMQIFLLGDVNQPGAYSVSGLATITNALLVGGGVSRSGSLRDIQLKRGGRIVRRLDLYDFLLRGDSSGDARLQAGDAIFSPPAGPRVAVNGAVIRPAIYELKGEATVKSILDLAGGLAATALRGQIVLDRIGKDGQRVLRELNVGEAGVMTTAVTDGDRLMVNSIYERADNSVSILGHVRYQRSFAWSRDLTLGKLLDLAQVRPSEPGRELYPVVGLVESTDLTTGLRNWRGVDLAAVLAGTRDEKLAANDMVLVLARNDVAYLMTPEVAAALRGVLPRPVTEIDSEKQTAALAQSDGRRNVAGEKPDAKVEDRRGQIAVCPALVELVKISDSARALSMRALLEAQVYASEARSGQANAAAQTTSPCPEVFAKAPKAVVYLLEHSAGLVGEVSQPGLYPFLADTPGSRLLAVAGGKTQEADVGAIEYFDPTDATAEVGQRFRKLDWNSDLAQRPAARAIYKFMPATTLPTVGSVSIQGEVRFPGRYVITRGERYSDIIRRAGGLNEEAYPYGTVFTRASARALEAEASRRAVSDLREALVNSATSGVSTDASTAPAVIDLIQKLESTPAVGRVVIEADPAILASRPGGDFLLEPGDAIFVPKRPNVVSVTGQVLSPGNLAFESGAVPMEYIKQAGGFSESADDDRSFLILPNGVARPLRTSFWSGRQQAIPPGSVIVVPRNVAPFTALLLTERITGVVANLALSVAALVTIGR